MSLIAMPFVGTGFDIGLHIVSSVVLVGTTLGALYGFWRFHELPIEHAHKRQHGQLTLVTTLTWIGFIWHWVWVLAIIIAFADVEGSIARMRDIWLNSTPETKTKTKTKTETETPKGEAEC